ncbi:hypothetical protein EW146_g7576 [Bondarzewia mesenterica]|uniref:Uncharacterized protein n=1 Tax=Bondarzewia mesenterica TaxID=1095465 RepID=A0A4S4LKD9_9AGAM|nr:hypothetical protein EW146_g7576 [Bondarzewia mesenterica]
MSPFKPPLTSVCTSIVFRDCAQYPPNSLLRLDPASMPTLLPNQGRYEGYPPPDLAWIYPDPTQDEDLTLMVQPVQNTPNLSVKYTSKDNHWALVWDVSGPTDVHQSFKIIRRLHIQQDVGRDHLTFWGPLTVTEDLKAAAPRFTVATVSSRQRKDLEDIASRTPVMEPDGHWNCQDWIRAVFDTAVAEDVLARADCDHALRGAEGIQPFPVLYARPCATASAQETLKIRTSHNGPLSDGKMGGTSEVTAYHQVWHLSCAPVQPVAFNPPARVFPPFTMSLAGFRDSTYTYDQLCEDAEENTFLFRLQDPSPKVSFAHGAFVANRYKDETTYPQETLLHHRASICTKGFDPDDVLSHLVADWYSEDPASESFKSPFISASLNLAYVIWEAFRRFDCSRAEPNIQPTRANSVIAHPKAFNFTNLFQEVLVPVTIKPEAVIATLTLEDIEPFLPSWLQVRSELAKSSFRPYCKDAVANAPMAKDDHMKRLAIDCAMVILCPSQIFAYSINNLEALSTRVTNLAIDIWRWPSLGTDKEPKQVDTKLWGERREEVRTDVTLLVSTFAQEIDALRLADELKVNNLTNDCIHATRDSSGRPEHWSADQTDVVDDKNNGNDGTLPGEADGGANNGSDSDLGEEISRKLSQLQVV